jgi:hypothetical protein
MLAQRRRPIPPASLVRKQFSRIAGMRQTGLLYRAPSIAFKPRVTGQTSDMRVTRQVGPKDGSHSGANSAGPRASGSAAASTRGSRSGRSPETGTGGARKRLRFSRTLSIGVGSHGFRVRHRDGRSVSPIAKVILCSARFGAAAPSLCF